MLAHRLEVRLRTQIRQSHYERMLT
jgi:hypothetical protein